MNATDEVLGSGRLRQFRWHARERQRSVSVTVKPDNLPAFTFTVSGGAAARTRVSPTSLKLAFGRRCCTRMAGSGTLAATTFDEHGNSSHLFEQREEKIGRLLLARVDSSGDLTASVTGSTSCSRAHAAAVGRASNSGWAA
jgi:hypothetical protein